MNARDDILGRVRAGVGKSDTEARRARAETYLAARQRGPLPTRVDDLLGRFRAQAEYLASTVDVIADRTLVPQAVAAYLAAGQLGSAAVATGDLADLDWSGADLQVMVRPAVDADRVGVSGCFCAIAETGTLMLLSGPDTPATISLLPETHIAVVRASRLVPTMEDAFAMLRAERGSVPRAINFISGPSRTGDIEQTIVLGAHGPCRVHLIILKDTP